MTTPIGVWVDDAPRVVLRDDYLDGLKDLGVKTAAIMVSSPSPGWDPVWSRDQVRHVARELVARDVEVVLTTWPSPRRAVVEHTTAWLESVADAGVAALEFDLEGQWKAGEVSGYGSLQEAAGALVLTMRGIAERHDLRLEVTTHPAHRECSPEALVTPNVDRFNVQAYSLRRRPGSGPLIEWTGRYGPGRHQRAACADALGVPGVAEGHVQLGVGLAAWSQQWPGHSPEDAMQTAYEAALEASPVEVRIWSSKFLQGAQENGYSAEWLRGLRG